MALPQGNAFDLRKSRLVFFAGQRALEAVRSQGLRPDDVQVVAGAAGGPKWLVLSRLDRLLFGSWFAGRRRPLHLLGASIGAWRFAAASCADPLAAIGRMEAAYIRQAYDHRPSPREVSDKSREIIDCVLGARGSDEILGHPFQRLSLLAVRSRHLLASARPLVLALGLSAAAAANLVSRRSLRWFFRQTLFADPRERPPFAAAFRPPGSPCRLTPSNLRPALLASGSIPLVMEGVSAIAGAAPGVYRDGGAVDYHLDVPFGLDGRGIVLFPHFSRRIVPGWFDKHLPWRHPAPDHLADVLLVAPSAEFVSRLPDAKIPDRRDFYRYAGDDRARFDSWRRVTEAGRRLADDFLDAVESGAIRERVRPLDAAARQ